MSIYSSVQWTCDRCGATVTVGSSADHSQPTRWGALWLVRPPLMAPADSDERPDQVCGDCVEAYFAWFNAGTQEDNEADKRDLGWAIKQPVDDAEVST